MGDLTAQTLLILCVSQNSHSMGVYDTEILK